MPLNLVAPHGQGDLLYLGGCSLPARILNADSGKYIYRVEVEVTRAITSVMPSHSATSTFAVAVHHHRKFSAEYRQQYLNNFTRGHARSGWRQRQINPFPNRPRKWNFSSERQTQLIAITVRLMYDAPQLTPSSINELRKQSLTWTRSRQVKAINFTLEGGVGDRSIIVGKSLSS
jgi:hypothetical protein